MSATGNCKKVWLPGGRDQSLPIEYCQSRCIFPFIGYSYELIQLTINQHPQQIIIYSKRALGKMMSCCFPLVQKFPKGHNTIPHTSSDTEPLGLCLALQSITLKCPEFSGLAPAGSHAWLFLPFLSCVISAASSSSDSIPSGSTDCPKCFHFLLGPSVLERSQRDYVYECLGREMHVRKWHSLQGYTWPLPRKRLFTQISWSPTKPSAWYHGIDCLMGAWSRKNSQRGGIPSKQDREPSWGPEPLSVAQKYCGLMSL